MKKIKKMEQTIKKLQRMRQQVVTSRQASQNPLLVAEAENIIRQAIITTNEAAIKTAAAQGWVIPLFGNWQEICAYLEANPTPRDIDAYFTNLFDASQAAVLESLSTDLSNSSEFIRSTLKEIVDAYGNGNYHITLFAAFAVLESLLSDINNPSNREPCKYNQPLLAKILNGDFPPITTLAALSISEFLNATFVSRDFNNSDPTVVNRHWSQHGRYTSTIGKGECLKVFSAICAAKYLLEPH